MQKPSGDKGFQRERDICLHFAHCPQLSNRFVFVFARVRPPRTRRRGARSNLGHCHPRHILGARQPGLQKAAERLGERRPHRALATRGRQGAAAAAAVRGEDCAPARSAPPALGRPGLRAEGRARPGPPRAASSAPPRHPPTTSRQSTFLGRMGASGSKPSPHLLPPPKKNWKEGREVQLGLLPSV